MGLSLKQGKLVLSNYLFLGPGLTLPFLYQYAVMLQDFFTNAVTNACLTSYMVTDVPVSYS